jgi:hypothetical protein
MQSLFAHVLLHCDKYRRHYLKVESNTEIKLPKATVLGIGEQVSEPLIAHINEKYTEPSENRRRKRKCVDEKLAHLFPEELAVIVGASKI